MTLAEQKYFDEQMDVLRRKMDPLQLERAWTSGHFLTMEQAIELALMEDHAPPALLQRQSCYPLRSDGRHQILRTAGI